VVVDLLGLHLLHGAKTCYNCWEWVKALRAGAGAGDPTIAIFLRRTSSKWGQ
jgi:hypothetical protein